MRRTADLKALAFAAATAGAMAAAAMGSVPTAHATCASFFGLGSGGQCTSNLTSIAIAFGTNAEAHAEGLFGAALTLGDAASAATVAGAVANLAVTIGANNLTTAAGLGSVALVASGIRQTVNAGAGNWASGSIGNLAVSMLGPDTAEISATGVGNFSANIFGDGRVAGDGTGLVTINAVSLGADLANSGVLSGIANLAGLNTRITNSGGVANLGFNVVGEDNVVRTDGTSAVAGTIVSIGQTLAQSGPGVNIDLGSRSAGSAAARGVQPAAAREARSTPARATRVRR